MGTHIIIVILWFAFAALAAIEYAPYCYELSKKNQFIVVLIFCIGGPFFAISNILTALLDCILPEGWDDDNDSKGL